MKKIMSSIGLISLLFLASTGNAQTGMLALNASGTAEQQRLNSILKLSDDDAGITPVFMLGARFMPTISSFGYHKLNGGAVETTFVLGYGFGGLIGVNASEHVGFQAEVIYLMLAQKYKEASAAEREVKLSYVNVPLMLVLNTDYNKPVNLNVCFGPQIGFNTGSKISSGESANGSDTINAVLAVKPMDVGFAYGAGLDFGSPYVKLSLGFRGVYGLLDISDNSKSVTTNEYYVLERAHVKTYSGYIGLTFGF